MNFLEKNLVSLKNLNPKLSKELEKAKQPDFIQEIQKKNFLIGKGSKVVKAYPDRFNFKHITKSNFPDQFVTIIVGCGYGHLVNAIIKKKNPKHIVIVFEKYPYFIKKTLEHFDLQKYISNGELIFACPGKVELNYTVAFIEAMKVVEAWATIADQYVMYLPEEYNEYIRFATEIVNRIQCNVGTVMAAGKKIATNDIENLPYVFSKRGVVDLKNLYKDKPAILVNTGPSLHKNIHHLIENQDKVIIIAVAQAMRILLAYDIIPDFICTVDYGKVNYEHFESLCHQQIPLIALNRSYDKILRDYQGPKFICVSSGLLNDKSAIGLMQSKGTIIQGGSVSHLNIGVASQLGCNPIAIIGQDLAYEKDLSHSPLADANGKLEINKETGILEWVVTDPRSGLRKKKNVMGMPQYVDGYFGENVMTNVGLKSFITSFEVIAKDNPELNLYDCTEGGADIKGFKNLALKDFINKFTDKKINKSIIKSLLSDEPNKHELAEKLVGILKEEIKDLEAIKDCAEKGLVHANEMLKKESNTKEYIHAMNRNSLYSDVAEHLSRKNQLMGLHLYNASRTIQSREYTVKNFEKINWLNGKKNKKDKKLRIERNKLILQAAKEGVDELIPLYEKSLDIIEKYHNTKDESILFPKLKQNINLNDVDKYFKINNWAHPLLDAMYILTNSKNKEKITKANAIISKAVSMKQKSIKEAKEKEKNERRADLIRYNNLILESRELGKNYKFEESLQCVNEALELFPDKFAAKWGKATILNFANRMDECIEAYNGLIKEYPDNTRFLFERAQAYLKIDIERGMQDIKELFKKTDKYDSFLVHLGHLFFDNKNYEKAVKFYNEYLEKFPYNPEAWKNKAICYKELNRKEEQEQAEKEYKKLTFK